MDGITAQMGDKVVVANIKNISNWRRPSMWIKNTFDDERVRKALSLALDRQDMAKTVGPLTGSDTVGGLMHSD